MVNLAQGHKSVSSGIVKFFKGVIARIKALIDPRTAFRAKQKVYMRQWRAERAMKPKKDSADDKITRDSRVNHRDSRVNHKSDPVNYSQDQSVTKTAAADAALSLLENLDLKKRERGKGGLGERGPLPPDWRPDERRDKQAIDKLGEIGAEKSLAKFRRHHKTSGVMLTPAGWNDRYENWTDDERVPPQRSLPLSPVVVPKPDRGFYARFDSEQLDAWERHSKRNGGRGYARDRDGGWWFPTEWPPDHDETRQAS